MTKKTVVVEVRERSPWGESVNESVVNDPGRTTTFVGGYSDKRAEFEKRVAEGKNPRPLPHRLQWARCERPNGDADGRRVAHWKKKGYAVPKWDELVKAGYTMELSAAQRGADGSARLGDAVLMWAPADVAAAHYKAARMATKEASDAYQKRVEDAVEVANKQMGYKPGSRGASGAIFELEREADKS